MKKPFLFPLVILLLFSCGGRAAKFDPPATVFLAVSVPADDPVADGCREFARLAIERSQGTLTVKFSFADKAFFPSLLANGRKSEHFDGGCATSLEMGSLVEEYRTVTLPFIFKDDSHYERVLRGDIGTGLLRSLESQDLIGLGFLDSGSLRLFCAKASAQRGLDDFSGLRVRLGNYPAMRFYIEKLGGSAASVPAAQISAALKQGLMNAAIGTISEYQYLAQDLAFREVSPAAFARNPAILFLRRESAEKLPSGALDLLRAAARDAWATGHQAILAQESKELDDLLKHGATIFKVGVNPKTEAAIADTYRNQSEAVKNILQQILRAR
jgi:TRAP-type C4-dicarboxylate transport system substrate-binding protein